MNNKIDGLIRNFKREKDVMGQIAILVEARSEIEDLQKKLAKTVR
jgi:hypothetical protein